MDDKKAQDRTAEVVAKAERLIAEAERAVEATRHLFKKNGVDPAKLMAYLKKVGGEKAEKELQIKMDAMIREINEDTKIAIEQQKVAVAPVRRARRMRTMV